MTLSVKDPMGNVTSLQYDAIDRTTTIKRAPVNGVPSNMTFLFQDADNSFGTKNEKGNYTDFDYDGLNRVTKVSFYKGALYTSPIMSQVNYTYTWEGKTKSVQDPAGNVTTYSFDYLNRLVKVVNPDLTTRITFYNDTNFIQSNYDENGHRIDYLYDPLQRLTGVRQYYAITNYYLTSYTYNGVGALTKMVDAKNQATTSSYDDLNRRVLTIFPDGFNETRSYDAVGNLVNRKDPNGKTITYGYDALNRPANITYPDNSKVTYMYDKNGNTLSLAYLGNSATFSYDSRNRETSETWTIGGSQYTLSYTYDQVGNIATIRYPDGTNVSFSTDAMNRATTVKSGSTTIATITYGRDSGIANITYGNGVQTTYRNDNRGRPVEIKTVLGQTKLMDLNYSYDGVGNVLSIGAESYSYDYLNRLTIGTGPWGTIKYGYDGVGNRLWVYQNPTNTTYLYGSYNRLTSAGPTSYTYDNNGNRITSVSGGITTRYDYDFENQLISVSQGSSTLGNYTYSPAGVRIQKIESGTTTTYVNRGVDVLYEKFGATVNDYIYFGSLLLAKLTGSSVFYFHQDLLGSTRLVTTGSTTTFSSNYQPFGQQYGGSGTDPTYKYTSKPQDAGTGLYYYGARYYDNGIGRFLSRDPISARPGEIDRVNQYAYAQNNPETFTDPSGQLTQLPTIYDQHCAWWGCYNLGVERVGLNEWDRYAVSAAIVAVGILCARAKAGSACGDFVRAVGVNWLIALDFISTDGLLYLYYATVYQVYSFSYSFSYTVSYTYRACAWWACWSYTVSYTVWVSVQVTITNTLYQEGGVYTNHMAFPVPITLGHMVYVPLWSPGYGNFNLLQPAPFPRDSPWPVGW